MLLAAFPARTSFRASLRRRSGARRVAVIDFARIVAGRPVLVPFVRRIVDEQRAPDGHNQGESDCEEGEGGSELAHFAIARRTDHLPQGYRGARESVDSQEQKARAPHKSFALSALGAKVFVLPRENGDSAGYRRADKYENARY